MGRVPYCRVHAMQIYVSGLCGLGERITHTQVTIMFAIHTRQHSVINFRIHIVQRGVSIYANKICLKQENNIRICADEAEPIEMSNLIPIIIYELMFGP